MMMKNKFEDLTSWSDKRLRTLRNNLNNRLASFSLSHKDPKPLQNSNILNGLDKQDCESLLVQVKRCLKNK